MISVPKGTINSWQVEGAKRQREFITFISLVCFPEIDDSDRFEAQVPQSDAAIPATSSKALFTCIHAENPRLQSHTHRKRIH